MLNMFWCKWCFVFRRYVRMRTKTIHWFPFVHPQIVPTQNAEYHFCCRTKCRIRLKWSRWWTFNAKIISSALSTKWENKVLRVWRIAGSIRKACILFLWIIDTTTLNVRHWHFQLVPSLHINRVVSVGSNTLQPVPVRFEQGACDYSGHTLLVAGQSIIIFSLINWIEQARIHSKHTYAHTFKHKQYNLNVQNYMQLSLLSSY